MAIKNSDKETSNVALEEMDQVEESTGDAGRPAAAKRSGASTKSQALGSGASRTARDPEKIELTAVVAAISKAQAMIEFKLDGTILTANQNFLQVMGYQLDEIKGRHHSLFVDDEYARSNEYREFWARLNRGEYQAAEYKRLGKHGREVWIHASYNPILDTHGRPHKVIKFATDVTADKLKSADYSGQIGAIGKSQAVIEFQMDGHHPEC